MSTAGTTMRAIIQENYGEAENVLRLGQTGRTAIADGEVLLRVHAAGVDRGEIGRQYGEELRADIAHASRAIEELAMAAGHEILRTHRGGSKTKIYR